MATLNIGMKVNRAITGATTVVANGYAQVTYSPSIAFPAFSGTQFAVIALALMPITRSFGPSQAVPASFTTTIPTIYAGSNTATNTAVTWTLISGFELINTI